MDPSLIDWSRAQFALTAMYHWLFVPLTLGLGVIMGIMETIYVVRGDEYWRRVTKFWMKIFGVNFAVGNLEREAVEDLLPVFRQNRVKILDSKHVIPPIFRV